METNPMVLHDDIPSVAETTGVELSDAIQVFPSQEGEVFQATHSQQRIPTDGHNRESTHATDRSNRHGSPYPTNDLNPMRVATPFANHSGDHRLAATPPSTQSTASPLDGDLYRSAQTRQRPASPPVPIHQPGQATQLDCQNGTCSDALEVRDGNAVVVERPPFASTPESGGFTNERGIHQRKRRKLQAVPSNTPLPSADQEQGTFLNTEDIRRSYEGINEPVVDVHTSALGQLDLPTFTIELGEVDISTDELGTLDWHNVINGSEVADFMNWGNESGVVDIGTDQLGTLDWGTFSMT